MTGKIQSQIYFFLSCFERDRKVAGLKEGRERDIEGLADEYVELVAVLNAFLSIVYTGLEGK